MTQISNLVSTDSRGPVDRMRRGDLQKACKAHNIPFDQDQPATTLREIIKGSNINVLEIGDWEQVIVKDEKGGQSVEIYPKRKPHATERSPIDYDAILDRKAKEQEELESKNGSLEDTVKELQAQLAQLLKKEKSFEDMTVFELKKVLKDRGIKTEKTAKKVELLGMLNGEDAS